MLMTNGNTYVAEIGIPAEVHLSPTFRDSIPSQVYFEIERGYWEVLLDEDHLGTQRPVGLRVVAEFSAADRQDAEDKTLVLGEKLGQFTSFYGGSPEHAPQLKRLAHTGSNRGILEQNVYFYFGDRDRLRQIEVKPYEFQKFLDRIGSLGEVPRQALELASSWYLNSLSSTNELDGYLAAWVGLEALGPLLDSFYHPGGQKSPCSVCGNRAGVKRDRKLAGIEHMIHRSAPELLAGRSVVELEQIRHEIAHCLKPQNQLAELTDRLLRELQLSLSAAILTVADRSGDYRRSFSSFLPRDYEVRPDARATIRFDHEFTGYQPYFGEWLEITREFPNEHSRLEANGSYVWGAATRIQWKLRIVSPPTFHSEYVMFDREGMNLRNIGSNGTAVPVVAWRDRAVPPSWQRLREAVS